MRLIYEPLFSHTNYPQAMVKRNKIVPFGVFRPSLMPNGTLQPKGSPILRHLQQSHTSANSSQMSIDVGVASKSFDFD